ncbi:MAG: glycosyltransferase family 2 protein [Clostridia bacterium]|nr:glycosyltransferase family 2 protein [Clostridia bacterium]
MKNMVIIPAYKPNKELITLVEELHGEGVGIVVVDDGSGPEYGSIFEAITEKAKIVTIVCNAGKGTALKTGMQTLINEFPDCENFVTADADGQHKTADIMRVFNELERGAEFVLTVRKFRDNMPFRSKFGNALSRWIYTILNGHYLVDNQSGLRGFLSKHLKWLVKVGGYKYDYEMNVLYYADKQGVQITTIPIEAIYIDNNSSSHFNPVKDTFRIYTRLFYSARITFAAWLLIEQMLIYVSVVWGYINMYITIPTIGATGVAFTITLNKFVVFRGYAYKDFLRTIIYTVLRYSVYTIGLTIFKFNLPWVPLFFSFNLIVILMIPAEYFVHKFLYLSKYNDIIKDR